MSSLQEQILSLDGVSRLSYADEPLFRIAFSKTTPYYAHNWLYVLRASHLQGGELGFKFHSTELVAVIGYRNDFVYVTPIVDVTNGAKLGQLCEELQKATKLQVIVKKLPANIPESAISLKSNVRTPLEDDSITETVLRLDKFFIDQQGTINPAAKHVARRARTFTNRGKQLTVIEDIRKVPLAALEAFLSRWPAKYRSYKPVIHYLHTLKGIPRHYPVDGLYGATDRARRIYR